MSNSNIYRVKDLYLAAYIYCEKVELINVQRESNVCWFLFNDLPKCEELAMHYWTYKGQVVAKKYTDALRTLKDLIFSKN